jgi:hypothetical protein
MTALCTSAVYNFFHSPLGDKKIFFFASFLTLTGSDLAISAIRALIGDKCVSLFFFSLPH